MSDEEIRAAVMGCSPIEHVDMYLASIWLIHPPSYELAEELAPNGAALEPRFCTASTWPWQPAMEVPFGNC